MIARVEGVVLVECVLERLRVVAEITRLARGD